MEEYVERAEKLLAEMLYMHASQCLNCGKAFHNIYHTHDVPRWWWQSPECLYNPRGWVEPKEEPDAT